MLQRVLRDLIWRAWKLLTPETKGLTVGSVGKLVLIRPQSCQLKMSDNEDLTGSSTVLILRDVFEYHWLRFEGLNLFSLSVKINPWFSITKIELAFWIQFLKEWHRLVGKSIKSSTDRKRGRRNSTEAIIQNLPEIPLKSMFDHPLSLKGVYSSILYVNIVCALCAFSQL